MLKTLVLSLPVLMSLLGGAAIAQDQAPAPTYRGGDTWQFTGIETGQSQSSTKALNGEFKVTFKGAGDIRVVPIGQQKSAFKQSVNELRRMLGITDDEKFLEFPLTVNKKWTSEFRGELRGGVTVDVHAEMVVSGYEEVTTGAGTFKAYKIERYETSAGGGTGQRAASHRRQVDYVYYYSPETRSIVKFQGSIATAEQETSNL